MESTTAANDVSKADATQSRSTIEFPYSDLDAAVEVARGVHNAGGTACDSEQLAAQLKMEASGGAFRLRINGAQTFGLVSYERGRVVLSELGRSIVDPERERAARSKAFFTVPLYAKVYEQFKGGPLPPPPALERAMVSIGVGQKVADRARQVMMRAAKQAGFFEQAADRLVKPSIKEDSSPQDRKKDGGDPSNGSSGGESSGGGNGGGGGQHPLIQGLLLTLPPPGTAWSSQDRVNWLTMAGSIFKMIYTGGKDGEAVVTYKGGTTQENAQ